MKNKKNYTPHIAIICTLLIVFCLTTMTKHTLSNNFWSFIANQLEKEHQERQLKIQNGEIIRGKDTLLIWGNMFEISHYSDGNHLLIKNKDHKFDIVIKQIYDYERINEKLYITSKEGFAIIDKNNFCRLYITVPDEEFINGYTIDANGNKHFISRYLKNKYIQYFHNINDFSIEEQKIFHQLAKRK